MFLVSAKLFGAEGRGVISYGTSVFASIGIILSLNLGRSFLSLTTKNESLKKEALSLFLYLNVVAIFLTAILSFGFWYFSESARAIVDFNLLIALMASSAYYVWSINGNAMFASFQNTHTQEKVILFTRFVLVIFIAVFYFMNLQSLQAFLSLYSFILCAGVLAEIIVITKFSPGIRFAIPKVLELKKVLLESIWPHLDFLAFNLFPLFLILISGKDLEKAQIGQINFTIQMINFVYLLSTTANIRVSSYVSVVGFRSRIPQLKKLFWGTLVLSLLMSIGAYVALIYLTNSPYFKSFYGSASLFGIAVLSIPGYLAYQILTPIWLEMRVIKQSAILSIINTCVFLILAFAYLPKYKEKGALVLFALFYCGLFLIQGFLLFKLTRKSSPAILAS